MQGWGLGRHWVSQLLALQGPGTRNAAWTSSSCRTDYLSCFPLLPPPPCADPLLPLLAKQGNHRVWKSWVFRRKQSHDPQGEELGVRGRASLRLGEKFGALPKPPVKGSVKRVPKSSGQSGSSTNGVLQSGQVAMPKGVWSGRAL